MTFGQLGPNLKVQFHWPQLPSEERNAGERDGTWRGVGSLEHGELSVNV